MAGYPVNGSIASYAFAKAPITVRAGVSNTRGARSPLEGAAQGVPELPDNLIVSPLRCRFSASSAIEAGQTIEGSCRLLGRVRIPLPGRSGTTDRLLAPKRHASRWLVGNAAYRRGWGVNSSPNQRIEWLVEQYSSP